MCDRPFLAGLAMLNQKKSLVEGISLFTELKKIVNR